MNYDFNKCLKNKRIVTQAHAKNLIPGELSASRTDFERTKKTYQEEDYKWSTIQAYYSMFHAARALLFNKGYREKSHICLKYALQELYVEEGILQKKFVDDFDVVMLLRETADYKSDFSKEGAETAIKNAEKFLTVIRGVLKKS